ncbi:MAG TPA: A24 family peptidase [Rhizobiaceae bacterium]|nr:A24 family peptidase [Rhizobiaceae bacterium]
MPANSETLIATGSFAVLCLLCSSLALIDLRRGIIPDGINLAIAVLGVAKVIVTDGMVPGAEAIVEALMVGMAFWLFRQVYFVLRKTQGLGLGDVKFLAAAVPWVGIPAVPTLLLIAALTALLAIGSAQLAGQNLTRQTSLPFGPFLAMGLLSTLALQLWLGVP